MFQVVITEKGGSPRVVEFDKNEVTIGRVQGNDIVLPKSNISKRHSRIVLKDGKFIIVDLKSTNGTYVNGTRITSPLVIKDADQVFIGDFTLTLESEEAADDAGLELDPEPIEDELDPDMIADDDDLWGDDDDDLLEPEAPPADDFGDDLGFDVLDGDPDEPEDVMDDLAFELDPEPEAPIEPDDLTPPPAPKPQPPVAPPATAAPAPAAPAKRVAKPARSKASGGAKRPRRATGHTGFQFSLELPPKAARQARAAVFGSVFKVLAQDGLPGDDDTTRGKAESAAGKGLSALARKLGKVDTDGWAEAIAAEVCGYGPLEPLLEDDAVEAIYVSGPHQIVMRRAGKLEAVSGFFSSEAAVELVTRRLIAGFDVEFDSAHPMLELRLPTGMRLHAVHHTVAAPGPALTLSRSSSREATIDQLVEDGVLSDAISDFLETCVEAHRNVLVVGERGAGKGTLLGAMGGLVDNGERIVLIQQADDVHLPQQQVTTLEPRPAAGARPRVEMQELVTHGVRMHPERLVVHEVTGAEAFGLVVAMGAGQDGSLVSMHGSSPEDGLRRLEGMMRMDPAATALSGLRAHIGSAVDVVVQLAVFADGDARVSRVSEVVLDGAGEVVLRELFAFDFDANAHVATGEVPAFYEALRGRGADLDFSVFDA